MAVSGKYVGQDAATLAALKTKFETARDAILVGGQSYSRPGFSFNKASLQTILDELAEIEYAISFASGASNPRTYLDLTA